MTDSASALTAKQHVIADDEDLRDWQRRLNTAREAQYSSLRDAAEKWAGALAVLIAAFGSISVLVVPKALEDFSNDTWRYATFGLATGAGAIGLLALGLALSVAHTRPNIDAKMDASKYKQDTINKGVSGVYRLAISRVLTLLAALLIVAASGISQWDTLTAESAGVNVLVVHRDGTTTCGAVDDVLKNTDAATTTQVPHC